jgi:hypothetical protein
MTTEPDQPLEPTITLVMLRAGARLTPSALVASAFAEPTANRHL